jgi:hypothetical protein
MSLSTSASDGGTLPAENGPVANISYIANRVWTGGDLPSDLGEEAMLADLADIQDAGLPTSWTTGSSGPTRSSSGLTPRALASCGMVPTTSASSCRTSGSMPESRSRWMP